MDIFIGYESALEYWRGHERDPYQDLSRAKPKEKQANSFNTLNTGLLESKGIECLPIHTLVATGADRRNSTGLISHVANKTLPNRSFVQASENLYVSSPELCFLQMAQHLPTIALVELGFELCGTYALHPQNQDLPFSKKSPRTSPQQILSLLRRCPRTRGVAQASEAIRYVVSDSASPMETILVMLLCLPQRLGGYALPLPKLNYPIRIERNQRATYWSSTRTFRCDLCWPEQKFALEYDSNQYHSGAEKINKDSRRRALVELGRYHTLSVTSRQIYDSEAFDELARITARKIGHRIRVRRSDFQERKADLRKRLLAKDEQPW